MRTVRAWFSLAVVLLFVGGFAGQAYGADPGDGHPYGPRGAPKSPAPKNPGGASPQGTPPKKSPDVKVGVERRPLTPAERQAAIAADPNGQGYVEQRGGKIIYHSLSKKQEEAVAAQNGGNSGRGGGGNPPKNLSGAFDAAKNAIAKAERDIAKAKHEEQKNHTAEIAAANEIRSADDRARALAAIPGTKEYNTVHALQQAAADAANAKSKKPTPLQALAAAVMTTEASRGGPSAAAIASQEAADARGRAAGAQALANANAQKKQAVDRAAKTSSGGSISGPGGSPKTVGDAHKVESNNKQAADHVAAADHGVFGHGIPQAGHGDGITQGPGR